MFCSSCETECSDDANFCWQCGSPLSRACGHCGRTLRPQARFCEGCGSPTAIAPSDTEPDGPHDDTPVGGAALAPAAPTGDTNRAVDRLMALISAAAAEDASGVEAVLSSELERRDRRRGVSAPAMTNDEFARSTIELMRLRSEEPATHVVATRGEEMALAEGGVVTEHGYEIRFLILVVLGPEDLIVRIENFDVKDLAPALARLDDLFVATLDPPDRQPFLRVAQGVHARNAAAAGRNATVPAGASLVDDGAVELSSLADDAEAAARLLGGSELGGITVMQPLHVVRSGAVLASLRTTLDVSEVTWPFVFRVDGDGLTVSSFAPDALTEARAALDAVTLPGAAPTEEPSGLPDENEDENSVSAPPRTQPEPPPARGARTNRADRLARERGVRFGDRQWTVVDTLGVRIDDFALHRIVADDGSKALGLSCWTATGEQVTAQRFDFDATQKAFFELDEWAGDTMPASVWRDSPVRRWAKATQDHDWDTARWLLDPEFEAEVHQLLGPESMSGDALVRWFESLEARSTQIVVATPEVHAVAPIGSVQSEEFEEIDAEGYVISNGGITANTFRNGRLFRSNRFDDGELDQALSALEEAADAADLSDTIVYMSEPARALRPG